MRADLHLVVQNAARDSTVPARAFIERCVRQVFVSATGELVVRIVDAAESAALNEGYRGKPGPTNVLAFPVGDMPGTGAKGSDAKGSAKGSDPFFDPHGPLGDLAICSQIVSREALEQGKPLEAHWAHMLIHGCLHLCGYDHETDAEAAAMEARECELLAGIGIPDPYRIVA